LLHLFKQLQSFVGTNNVVLEDVIDKSNMLENHLVNQVLPAARLLSTNTKTVQEAIILES
jgi:hypothetical protein